MALDNSGTEMVADANSEKGDYTNRTYEIIMVSIAGSIMLVSAVILLLAIMRRRWGSCASSYNAYTEETGVSSINVNRNTHDNISTIDFNGPVHITYVTEKEKPPSEIPISRVKLSREALLYISLITCMNLPDDIDSEETL